MKKKFSITIFTIILIIISLLLYIFNNGYHNFKVNAAFEKEAIQRIDNISKEVFSYATDKIETITGALLRSAINLKKSNITTDLFNNNSANYRINISGATLIMFDVETLNSLQPYAPGYEKEMYNILAKGSNTACSISRLPDNTQVLNILMPYNSEDSVLTIIGCQIPIDYFTSLCRFPIDEEIDFFVITANGSTVASNTHSFVGQKMSSLYGSNISSYLLSYGTSLDNENKTESESTSFVNSNDKKDYFYIDKTSCKCLYFVAHAREDVLTQSSSTIAGIIKRFSNINMFILVGIFILSLIIYQRYLISLKTEKKRYSILLSSTKDITWEYDILNDTLLYSNPATDTISSKNDGLNCFRSRIDLPDILPNDLPLYYDFCEKLTDNQPELLIELRVIDKENNIIWYKYTAKKVFDANNKPVSVIGQIINIDEQKREYEQLKMRSLYDPLTNLLTKSAFTQEVDVQLEKLPKDIKSALILVDIDDFRTVNENLGHAFGDAVLIDIATKFKNYLYNGSPIGRQGGDSIAVFIENFKDIDEVCSISEHLLNLVREVVTDNSSGVIMTASIGIAISPEHGSNVDALITSADNAMYYVKVHGKNNYKLYDTALDNIKGDVIKKKAIDDTAEHLYSANTATVDSKIIADCIEILTDSRNLNISMQMILSLIGSYFGLDRITITEFDTKYSYMNINYEWASSSKYNIINKSTPYAGLVASIINKSSDSHSSCFYFDNLDKTDNMPDKKYEYYKSLNIKSLFESGISDHGQYIGFVSYCYCKKENSWKPDIIATLELLTKIIGSHLIRINSQLENERITRKDSFVDAYNYNTFLAEAGNMLNDNLYKNYAVISSDLRNFKLINDNYGYRIGDMIIKKIADIYNERCLDKGLLCRIAGDKFAALLEYTTKEDLEITIKSILYDINHINNGNKGFYKLSPAIGIYCIDSDTEAVVALDYANIALKYIKANRSIPYTFFSEDMRSGLLERKQIEDIMEDALKAGEFEVYFQPKIALSDETLFSSEALVRWNKPGQGLIPPSKFVPVFEDNGFIIQIDLYILEKVCAFLRHLIDIGKTPRPVSVNFSRLHFTTDTLSDILLDITGKYNITPDLIEIEITESLFTADDRYMVTVLKKIHHTGFKISMDDFGSGLSSLNMLSNMPFDTLKLDKDFFHSQSTSERERIVISNVIKMAGELKMDVVCEGVETLEQVEFLRSVNCHLAQGYFYDKPLPLKTFEEKYFS